MTFCASSRRRTCSSRTAFVSVAKEFSASYGVDLLNGRGYLEGTYVHRDVGGIIEDFIDIANGTTPVSTDGFDVGTFTNVDYRNTTGLAPYEACSSRPATLADTGPQRSYTLQLNNDGNLR